MNGDFSTLRFDSKKRFAKVMHQQGRVMTDADLNEASAIAAYFDETERIDVIGQSGTPAHDAAFLIAKPDGSPAGATPWAQLSLTTGRYYVDGKMVELFPNSDGSLPLLSQQNVTQPTVAGNYWAVLEAYERYVSPTEDSDIVEEALRGPDTSGRTRFEWRVKLVADAGATDCDSTPGYQPRSSFGTMSAFAPTVTAASDPCETPNIGGYQGLENQLYRIEVHNGTADAGGLSIKWSRENGSLLSQIGTVDSVQKLVQVLQPGHDSKTGFQSAMFVEALSQQDLHDATSGALATVVTSTDEQEVEVTNWADLGGKAVQGNFLRGWHGYITAVAMGTAIPIDDKGLTITFGAGTLVKGDYWIVPARAISGNVIWPMNGAVAKQLPPFGTKVSSAVLGLYSLSASKWTMLSDCRNIFYPLTELERFVYVSGDGQEAMPGFPITGDLVVGVVNGPVPVLKAKIRWTVVQGSIAISLPAVQNLTTGSTLTDLTGADGMSRVRVTQINSEHVAIKAELLGSGGNPVETPIIFNLNESKASMVSYDPLAGCNTLQGKTTVQMAIDRLASIRRMQLLGGDTQVAYHDPAVANAFLPLPESLRVRVASLCGPVPNATVTFAVVNGVPPYSPGTLAEIAPEGSTAYVTTLNVQTDANGVAACQWKPTFGVAQPQRVQATFASDGFATTETIYFDYQSLAAKDIAFTPHCTVLNAATTVQQALDTLCNNLGHGGCEFTVGQGGQFPDLPTAVAAVLPKNYLSVTLCLLPSPKPYSLSKQLDLGSKPNMNLEIHGGGPLTNLQVKGGGITVRQFGGFTLRNLHIQFQDDISRVEVVGLQQFEIDHCQIERAVLKQKVPLVLAQNLQSIRISDSAFDARRSAWTSFLAQLAQINPNFALLWAPEVVTETSDLLAKRLAPFVSLAGADLDNTKSLLSKVLAQPGLKDSDYQAPIGLWQEAVGFMLGAKQADLPELTKRFVTEVSSAFKLVRAISGVGVILDPNADCWVESNDFSSLVSFSGQPISMNSDLLGKFFDATLKKLEISIAGNGRVTRLTNNSFDAIVFGQSLFDWMNTPPKPKDSVAWPQAIHASGNDFRVGTSGLFAFAAHVTNNQFAAEISGDAAWVAATQFVPVANVGFAGAIKASTKTNLAAYKPINAITISP